MALQNLKEYDWFTDGLTKDELARFESCFQSSDYTQRAIVIWANRELVKLDKEMNLSKIMETPDRGELALMVAAQREMLLKLVNLLTEETDNG